MGKPEHSVEGYLQTMALKHGCICYKFTSPGNRGVPDRVVIGYGKNGEKHTDFIETKAPGEKPRLLQKIIHDEMREHGASVYVLCTRDTIDQYFAKFFEPKEKRP